MNKTLRPNMADKSALDILVLFSMILGEAVDEGLIGSNPRGSHGCERAPAGLSAVAQVSQGRHDASTGVDGGGEAEFGKDIADVLADGGLGDDE